MKTKIRLTISDVCSAFNESAIGTRVCQVGPFFRLADNAVQEHDFTADRVPGQGFLQCPELVPYVSAGVGPKSSDPTHYVCREHRGVVSAYLRREFAAPVTNCALVVYTAEAYLLDPDITLGEAKRIELSEATHVLVAVLAYAGPESPLPPYRLVWNLAGGNHEALLYTADEIRTKAKAAIDYESAWSTVAD